MTTHYPDFGAAAGAAMEANTAMAARHTAARTAETTTRKDTQMTTSPADPVRPTDAHTTVSPEWAALAEVIAALPPAAEPHPDRDRRARVAAALLARIKQAVIPPSLPGQIGSLFAATEYDLADAVLASLAPELDELLDYRNRITWETTCGEHARLLDACHAADGRAEQAEAALAEVRAMHKPRTERHGSGCVQCGIIWPCPTYRKINAVLDTPAPAAETEA